MNNSRPLTDEEGRALVNAYHNCSFALKRNIRKYFYKPEMCEDCEQETLLWTARHIDSFMASANKEGWLINASNNVAMKMMHSEKSRAHLSIESDDMIQAVDSDGIETDDQTGRNAVINEVKKHLSKKNAELFDSIMVKGRSDEELSKEYGISKSAVRGKRKRLAEQIRSLPDDVKEKLWSL